MTAISPVRSAPGDENSETTPLLAASYAGPPSQANEEVTINATADDEDRSNEGDRDDGDRPLPKTQIFLLVFARLVEPVAFFSIFPYINKMISETGNVAETDVGFYSGLIESLFSLTQMIVMLFWGRAADRFGRKPVTVLSLGGVTIATALFGLSRTIWQMVLFRCIAGAFAGTVVTIRTMISEHSTRRTQARAFAYFSLCGNLGIALGPLLGGALANPVEQYPGVFGQSRLFKQYPYLLPSLCTASLGAIATLTSALFVKETLKRKDNSDESPSDEADGRMSAWSIIKSPGVLPVLWIYGHTLLLGLSYTALVTIFLYTSAKLGGLQFSPPQISFFMAAGGLSQVIWGVFIFPPLQHRFSTGGVLRVLSYCWPLVLALNPVCNELLKQHWTIAFWIAVPMLAISLGPISMSFTAVQLCINDVAPSQSTLGTLNGIALSLVSGIRAIVPAMFASLYATGVKYQIIDGQLGWAVLVAASLCLTIAMRWLPPNAEGRLERKNGD